MSDYIHARELKPGEVVFYEGDVGDDAYIIEEGLIEISVRAGDGEKVIAALGPGEIIGEMALIANAPRSATARALKGTTLLVLRRNRLMKPIEKADPLTRLMLQMMTERLNEASRGMAGHNEGPGQTEAGRKALEEVRDIALRRVSTERQLRRATEAGEFSLHYQPIVGLADGRLAGYEALMRWYHTENGFVSPGEFIPLAEDTGMIVEMGRWALEQGLADHHDFAGALPAGAPQPFVSINVSAAQLFDPKETGALAAIISGSGVAPEQIKLELTESLLVEGPDHAAAALSRLKDTGVKLAIDDFGTGFSSLSYLHRFPFDTLKIDRAFVCRMAGDAGSRQLVQSIVDMAGGLGMDTVAEGIEDIGEIEMLRGFGSTYGQGFLIAKPMTAADMSRRIGQTPGPFVRTTQRPRSERPAARLAV
ncbi:MAG: EAL domain-containing protein [Minwuia sp.]|uniref:EAL domain-containing protein n=1 Tax=Minwuia sp. TaxID=2493630 RepID=UPI003A882872